MIQLRSMLRLADNSGAKILMVIGVSHRIGKTASVGDVVRCVVKGAGPSGSVSDKEKVKALSYDLSAALYVDVVNFAINYFAINASLWSIRKSFRPILHWIKVVMSANISTAHIFFLKINIIMIC